MSVPEWLLWYCADICLWHQEAGFSAPNTRRRQSSAKLKKNKKTEIRDFRANTPLNAGMLFGVYRQSWRAAWQWSSWEELSTGTESQ